jgi:hypothetical protein
VVLLFRNLLLPAIRSPENWGLWTAAEHGTISTQVLLSHSSPSASQPPSKRGTVIFAQSAGAAASIHAENLYRQLDAIANLLEDLSGLFIGIERQSASLDDILVVHTLYEEFERSLRDLCRWLTKSSAAATASSTNDSSGVGVASDGLEHWMIRDELNCIAEDFLVTCWEHLKSPVYPELNSAYLELTNGYLQVQITQQQVAEARLRAATASAAAPNNRRPTSRKSVLIKWQKPFLNGNSNTNSSDSD